MNTPATPDHDDLRYAEYVLGVLDRAERAAIEQDVADNPQAAAALALWQQRLLPLSEEIESSTPPDYVWARIRSELNLAQPVRDARPRTSWWDSLVLWRWLGIGASTVAAASIAFMLIVPRPVATPTATSAGYMASTMEQDNGRAGWTATMDLQHARMIVVPASPTAMAAQKSPELWLIPDGKAPISLGVIAGDKPTSIALRPDLLAQLSATAVLAVTMEPAGGSPTGKPTGAVMAKGPITST